MLLKVSSEITCISGVILFKPSVRILLDVSSARVKGDPSALFSKENSESYIVIIAALASEESFFKSLPISGKSGTLKYFGDESVFEEEFFGKSGSMGGVRCYSGYLRKNSKYYPFTIMVNNFTSKDYLVRKKIEELVVNIYKSI